ncbi:hypothetical protein L6452_33858 [Arctium lappa]|uniref:Uncharacterized protein n=1 Tax=Arctium lappa TaxID=4217 RepID=A0ACB8YH59_ARCLA|nr:hypothetical protein L6452_33858 [Arctium lappa]
MRSFGNPYPVKFLYKDFTSSDSSILPCIDIFLGFIMPKAHLRNSFFVKSIQCVEARGFIFGPPIALAIGAKFWWCDGAAGDAVMQWCMACVPFMEWFCCQQLNRAHTLTNPMGPEEGQADDLWGRALRPDLYLSVELAFKVDAAGIPWKLLCMLIGVIGAVISEEYSLEYGTDIMEMHVGAVQAGERVLVIDDLIATGGTLVAAMKLLERVGASIVECACVIELPDLKTLKLLSKTVKTVLGGFDGLLPSIGGRSSNTVVLVHA